MTILDCNHGCQLIQIYQERFGFSPLTSLSMCFFDKLEEHNHFFHNFVMIFFLFFSLLLISADSISLSTVGTAVSDPSCLPNQTPFQIQWKMMEDNLDGFIRLCVKHGSCSTLEIPKNLGILTSYVCITNGVGSIIKFTSDA